MRKMETIPANGLSWLTRHAPGGALIVIALTVVIGGTVVVTNFVNDVSRTREMVIEIKEQDIPGLRREMDKRFESIDKRFDAVDKRFFKIEERLDRIDSQLNKIINYIERKEGIPPKFP